MDWSRRAGAGWLTGPAGTAGPAHRCAGVPRRVVLPAYGWPGSAGLVPGRQLRGVWLPSLIPSAPAGGPALAATPALEPAGRMGTAWWCPIRWRERAPGTSAASGGRDRLRREQRSELLRTYERISLSSQTSTLPKAYIAYLVDCRHELARICDFLGSGACLACGCCCRVDPVQAAVEWDSRTWDKIFEGRAVRSRLWPNAAQRKLIMDWACRFAVGDRWTGMIPGLWRRMLWWPLAAG